MPAARPCARQPSTLTTLAKSNTARKLVVVYTTCTFVRPSTVPPPTGLPAKSPAYREPRPRTRVCPQKRLILAYAQTQLRPQNLGGQYASSLEIWWAPGDSEMDVVRNLVDLKLVSGSAAGLPADFNVDMVGFHPEIYVGDEITQGGLRVERDEQGRATKPVFDVNQSE